MATIYELVKLSFAKRKERALEDERRAHPLDAGLPLGLHIDGKVDLHPILPSGHTMAGLGKTHVVQAFARAKLFGNDCFRVLLHSEADDQVSYLLILKDAEGLSIRWFMPFDAVYPQNNDEWLFWIADSDGSIGLSTFQTKEGVLYDRLWRPGESQRIPPVSYEETVYPDRYDAEKRFAVKHDCMLYGRRIEDAVVPRDELMLLSAIDEPDGSSIAIDIGIDVDQKLDLTVLY